MSDIDHKMNDNKKIPLIYSCSGCSSAAQMANAIAVKIDRKGTAEMSCIAGVGGNVQPLVKIAKSSRKIVALDGCPLNCVKHCLANHGVSPNLHYVLSDFKVPKKYHEDFDQNTAIEIQKRLEDDIEKIKI